MPDQKVSILGPKENDVLKAGSVYEIEWKTEVLESEFGAMVTIEFSKDGGESWETVKINVPNTGKYEWEVPKIDSKKCKVRVISQHRPQYRGTSGMFSMK